MLKMLNSWNFVAGSYSVYMPFKVVFGRYNPRYKSVKYSGSGDTDASM